MAQIKKVFLRSIFQKEALSFAYLHGLLMGSSGANRIGCYAATRNRFGE
jgi:hypothetical protein